MYSLVTSCFKRFCNKKRIVDAGIEEAFESYEGDEEDYVDKVLEELDSNDEDNAFAKGCSEGKYDKPDLPLPDMIDWNTACIKVNTEEKSNITNDFMKVYKKVYKNMGGENVTVGDIFNQLDLEDFKKNRGTHMILSFENVAGRRFSIPFSFDHPKDAFPAEDINFFKEDADIESVETIVLVFMNHETKSFQEMKMTNALQQYSWDSFKCGSRFRIHAWTWLSMYAKGPEALLFFTRGRGVNKERQYIYFNDVQAQLPNMKWEPILKN